MSVPARGFATALLSANVHPAVVQSALGHSSITLTIDTYSHVMPGLEEAAARSIDDVLGRCGRWKFVTIL
jgi:integrase